VGPQISDDLVFESLSDDALNKMIKSIFQAEYMIPDCLGNIDFCNDWNGAGYLLELHEGRLSHRMEGWYAEFFDGIITWVSLKASPCRAVCEAFLKMNRHF
jgi:hypothetical protein